MSALDQTTFASKRPDSTLGAQRGHTRAGHGLMSKPHIAERLCNSQLFSAGFRVWSTLLSVQQAVGDSQVLGSTRNKQYSSATTVAAIFILGTFSAQPDPQCISALLHFTGHRFLHSLFSPAADRRGGGAGERPCSPSLCAGSGAEQSCNTHGASGSRDVREQR